MDGIGHQPLFNPDDEDESMDDWEYHPGHDVDFNHDSDDFTEEEESEDSLDMEEYMPPIGKMELAVVKEKKIKTKEEEEAAKEEQKMSDLEKEFNLKTKLTSMVNNDKMADVYFLIPMSNTIGKETVIGDHRVAGHRMILSLRSPVFEAMFYGLMSESIEKCPEIKLPDIELNGFMTLLKYLYTDVVDVEPSNVITTFYAAKKYLIDKLAAHCDYYLKHEITPSNVLIILNNSLVYGDYLEHVDMLWAKLDEMAADVFDDDSFLNVSKDLLIQIINNDHLSVTEVDLFKAIIRWSFAECVRRGINPKDGSNIRDVLGTEILHKIRFPTMPSDEFAFHSGIEDGYLTPQEQSSIFTYFVQESGKKLKKKSGHKVSLLEDTSFDTSMDQESYLKDTSELEEEPSPRATCSKYQEKPQKVSPIKKVKQVEEQQEPPCPFPVVPRSGMIIPTPKSTSSAAEDGTYVIRRFGSFKIGKTCEFDEFHKVDFTVSIPIIVTGIGIFGTKAGDLGQERVVLVELIEQATGTVVASGKLRFETEKGIKVYHVSFNEPVLINPNTIYTASSNFDHNYPFHTYHGIHGKRIITITSRTPEPNNEDDDDAPKEPKDESAAARQQYHLRMINYMERRHQDEQGAVGGGGNLDVFVPPIVPPGGRDYLLGSLERDIAAMEGSRPPLDVFKTRLESLQLRLKTLETKFMKKKGIVKEPPKQVFKQVTFTFFKTETCKALNGTVTTYTGDTCGTIGQIPHILFKFN